MHALKTIAWGSKMECVAVGHVLHDASIFLLVELLVVTEVVQIMLTVFLVVAYFHHLLYIQKVSESSTKPLICTSCHRTKPCCCEETWNHGCPEHCHHYHCSCNLYSLIKREPGQEFRCTSCAGQVAGPLAQPKLVQAEEETVVEFSSDRICHALEENNKECFFPVQESQQEWSAKALLVSSDKE